MLMQLCCYSRHLLLRGGTSQDCWILLKEARGNQLWAGLIMPLGHLINRLLLSKKRGPSSSLAWMGPREPYHVLISVGCTWKQSANSSETCLPLQLETTKAVSLAIVL